MRPHRLMPPLLSPTTTTTLRPSAVRWPHRLMPPLLEQPSSPTTATTSRHLVVMMLALLGLEGSQTRKLPSLPSRPSLLTTATTPSLPAVILPQPQQLSSLPARLIHTDDSANAISVSGDAAIADGSRRFSDLAASITAIAPNLHSTDGCCSDTFICTLCSAGVRVLFDLV